MFFYFDTNFRVISEGYSLSLERKFFKLCTLQSIYIIPTLKSIPEICKDSTALQKFIPYDKLRWLYYKICTTSVTFLTNPKPYPTSNPNPNLYPNSKAGRVQGLF